MTQNNISAEVLETLAPKLSKSRLGRAWKKSFGKDPWYTNVIFFPYKAAFFAINLFRDESNALEKADADARALSTKELSREIFSTSADDLAKGFTLTVQKKAKIEDPELQKDVKSFAYAVFNRIKQSKIPEAVMSGIDKTDKDEKKGWESMEKAEIREITAVGTLGLVDLKRKFKSEKEFKKFLKRLEKPAKKSPQMKLYLNVLLKSFFYLASRKDAESLGLPAGSLDEISEIKSNRKRRNKYSEILAENLFPKAVTKHGMDKMSDVLYNILGERKGPDAKQVAEFVYLVENDELVAFANRIAATEASQASPADITEASSITPPSSGKS